MNLGQLLIIGFDGSEMSPRLASLLTRIQPGGVILFARNITGAAQTYNLLRECQKCVAEPLFTCVDLEGGTVDRLRNVLAPAPSAAAVFASGNRKLFREHGRIIGENCRALGFNVDFAPVLDLAFEASRKVMGSRSVSADPKAVVGYAREFLRGLDDAGVLGCGKHFPGLGEGTLDSHLELPVIQKTLKKMWAEDLYPYRALRSRLPFVMVAHAAYPDVTGKPEQASLSKKWITGILRQRIEYKGLIVSDDLEMGAVLNSSPVEETAAEHMRAGGDLVLICHKEELVVRGYEGLVRAAEKERRFAARVAEAGRRIERFKRRRLESGRRRGVAPTQEKTARLTRRLWEFGEEVRVVSMERGTLDNQELPA